MSIASKVDRIKYDFMKEEEQLPQSLQPIVDGKEQEKTKETPTNTSMETEKKGVKSEETK